MVLDEAAEALGKPRGQPEEKPKGRRRRALTPPALVFWAADPPAARPRGAQLGDRSIAFGHALEHFAVVVGLA